MKRWPGVAGRASLYLLLARTPLRSDHEAHPARRRVRPGRTRARRGRLARRVRGDRAPAQRDPGADQRRPVGGRGLRPPTTKGLGGVGNGQDGQQGELVPVVVPSPPSGSPSSSAVGSTTVGLEVTTTPRARGSGSGDDHSAGGDSQGRWRRRLVGLRRGRRRRRRLRPSTVPPSRERMVVPMTDHLHRHDVWGDDPEERDASAVVEELLAEPGHGEEVARPPHDRLDEGRRPIHRAQRQADRGHDRRVRRPARRGRAPRASRAPAGC